MRLRSLLEMVGLARNKPTIENRKTTGRLGEDVAEKFLRSKGMRIVERNFVCYAGELDIVAMDGGDIVFVEVKAKKSDRIARPVDTVTRTKRRRLSRIAQVYYHQHRLIDTPCRCDIVSIMLREDGKHEIEHFENAFPLMNP
jgi:putative endonuclease